VKAIRVRAVKVFLEKQHTQQQRANVKMDSATIKRVGIEKAQNFMRQYRDPESRELKKLSANQFMDVWSHYDKDGECGQKMILWDFSAVSVN
jgi:hypothetical protein